MGKKINANEFRGKKEKLKKGINLSYYKFDKDDGKD